MDSISLLPGYYTYDRKLSIWSPKKGFPDFNYNDGDEVEERLLNILSKAKDLRTLSNELRKHQTDWPSTYHLSDKRANLLRPLGKAIKKANILELGCGCGGLTRFLGENALGVIAVDGSPRRAACTALRCRDLENVKVIVDKFQDLSLKKQSFDLVTLIGSLEYSRIYENDAECPELKILNLVRSFLKPDGLFLLGIENRFGLKYLAGLPEEHTGFSWQGVTGGYGKPKDKTVITFGRKELEQLLFAAGFKSFLQFVPIPDYKLPSSILLPAGLDASREEFNRAEFLHNSLREYDDLPLFDLNAAWDGLDKDSLTRNLANSLCFVAGQKETLPGPWPGELLATHYSSSPSALDFKEKLFVRKNTGIVVQQRLLGKEEILPSATESEFVQNLNDEEYINGISLQSQLVTLFNRPNWAPQDLAECVKPWVDWLKESCQSETTLLDAIFMEAAPAKFIFDKKNTPHLIAKNWLSSSFKLELSFIVSHGICAALSSIHIIAQPQKNKYLHKATLVLKILNILDLHIEKSKIEDLWKDSKSILNGDIFNFIDWNDFDKDFFILRPSNTHEILFRNKNTHCANKENINGHADKYKTQVHELKHQLFLIKNNLEIAETALKNIYSSRSWRITAPIRLATNFLRNLRIDSKRITEKELPVSNYPEKNVQTAKPLTPAKEIAGNDLQDLLQYDEEHEHAQPYIPHEQPCPIVPPVPSTVKAIAFYLPQFHPIPENDLWWGAGFTEWTNVSKANPIFPGHHQPRLPADLGFYDLRLTEVMQKQIKMAQEFGVHGFCFHYYWFSGKRLLERPLEQFLDNQDLKFPFCLNWANENWTRTWDGAEQDLLIAQTYSPQDDLDLIQDLLRYFRDPRYIRIAGRPVFLVYNASRLPEAKKTLHRWRQECLHQGESEPYFILVQSYDNYAPGPKGFDAAVQFPPHIPSIARDENCDSIPGPKNLYNEFKGTFYSYAGASKRHLSHYNPALPAYPCIVPDWDNTARRASNSMIFLGATPQKYAEWLYKAGQLVKKHFPADRQFVFINAWNEWAEGTYLEPDRLHGHAYINATSRALARLANEDS